MNKFIIALGAFVLWSNASTADAAFQDTQAPGSELVSYKKFELLNLRHLYADGFMHIELRQGEFDNVEIYLRKDTVNTIRVGKEMENGQTKLIINEIYRDTDEHWDKQPLAHIVISAKQLDDVEVHDIHKIDIQKFDGGVLSVKATGRSKVLLNEIDVDALNLKVHTKSEVEVNNSSSNSLVFVQNGHTHSTFSGYKTSSSHFHFGDFANFAGIDFVTGSLTFNPGYKSSLVLKGKSKVGSASLSGIKESSFNLEEAEVDVVGVTLKHNAKATFGVLKVLNAHVSDNAKIVYQGEPAANIEKYDKAVVEKAKATTKKAP